MTPSSCDSFQPLETLRVSRQLPIQDDNDSRISKQISVQDDDARFSSRVYVLGGRSNDHDDDLSRQSSKVMLHEGIPPEIWDDLVVNARRIYMSLMFLTASVMWAYYSCVVAQDFYSAKFPDVEFSYWTTMATSWPMVIAHALQLILGLDKRLTPHVRVQLSYGLFIVMAIAIVLCSIVDWSDACVGAAVLLVCFAIVGAANALSQSVFYALAAQFPMERFTNAVQIGNVWAGVVNVTLTTFVRLCVGGLEQGGSSQATSFYVSFALLVLVCVAGLVVFVRLMSLPCILYLIERNALDKEASQLDSLRAPTPWREFKRIVKIIWQPASAQFLAYFISLMVYPGIGCTAARILSDDTVAARWYCSPGVVASANFGDCMGRIMSTAAVYRVFTMRRSLWLTAARVVFIPLMIMSVASSDLYVFGSAPAVVPLSYGLVMNLLLGITGGVLSTVTMGAAPLIVESDDRDAVSAVMVLALFLGQASGSSIGLLIGEFHVLGV